MLTFPPSVPVVPLMAVVSRGADKIIQVVGVGVAEVGLLAGTYLGANGPVTDINEAVPIEGADGLNGSNSVTLVGTSTVAETAALAISAGIRQVTANMTGVAPGQAYTVVATGTVPTGYALHDCYASANNVLKVNVSAPLLAIGQNYSIPIKVFKLS